MNQVPSTSPATAAAPATDSRLAFFGISVMLPVAAIWLFFNQGPGGRMILGGRRSTSHRAILAGGLMLPLAAMSLAFGSGWNATGRWILGVYGLLLMLQIIGMRIMLNLLRTIEEKA